MAEKNVSSVPENGLCTGCGMCAGICPAGAVRMEWDAFGDTVACIDDGSCTDCGLCLDACPGRAVDFASMNRTCGLQALDTFRTGVGTHTGLSVLQACSASVLNAATSGGAARVVAAQLIEQGLVDGILMVTETREKLTLPFHAQAGIFSDPEQILAHRIRSRYCPAPLLEMLRDLAEDSRRYAVVGLPCHIHAIRKLQARTSLWKEKIACTLGLVCGGTPLMNAHSYLMRENGVDMRRIRQIDYRHGAWPKGAYAAMDDGDMILLRKTGGVPDQGRLFQMIGEVFMSPYFWRRRCLFCADYFNLYADIVFGDPWIPRYGKDLGGGTLTIVRSKRLQPVLDGLVGQGRLKPLMEVEPAEVDRSMGAFQRTRMSSFSGYERYARLFHMDFPRYDHLEIPRGNPMLGMLNLLKAHMSARKGIWPFLKYVQFMEEGTAFIRRRIGGLWK